MAKRVLFSVVAATVFVAMTAAPARADTFDKLTYLTFNRSIQVPGATLSPGTYRFHLTNPDTSRNVMQVLSDDGSVVYSMFHTIPAWRSTVTDDPFVTFMEVPAGVAPPMDILWYGGESNGYEFIYGKGEPNMTPPPEPLQPAITYSAPEPVIAPAPEPVEEVAAEPAPIEETPAPEVAPAELPKTATRLPLAATGGVTLLLLGAAIGLLRRAG